MVLPKQRRTFSSTLICDDFPPCWSPSFKLAFRVVDFFCCGSMSKQQRVFAFAHFHYAGVKEAMTLCSSWRKNSHAEKNSCSVICLFTPFESQCCREYTGVHLLTFLRWCSMIPLALLWKTLIAIWLFISTSKGTLC